MAAASFALAGILAFTVNPSSAAPGGMPKAFANEADQATYPGFTASTLADLSPKCPQGIAATPGSEPSNKYLNPKLNDANSFKPGGTVHYSYIDNPNFASENYTIQDCVAVYPEDTFSSADFDPITGVLLPSSGASKSDMNKGVQIDGAAFSGVFDSTGSTYYSWTAPSDLVGGQWVCNFARDIATGHGGGGNRKAAPSCYQVPKSEVIPDTPQVIPGACGEKDTISLPPTEGISWFHDDKNTPLANGDPLDPGQHTVIAQVPGQDDTTYPVTASTVEAPDDCKTPITADAATLSIGCGRVDRYTIPNDSDVDYYIGNNVVAPGTYDLAQGVSVTIDAVAKDPANDLLGGTTQWMFTGSAITACSQTPPPPPPPVIVDSPTTTTTTEAPTTTTTSLPELAFTPEPEAVTTTTAPPAPELAFTGSNTGYLVSMGLVMVGFGSLLYAGTNRRRRTTG